MVLAYERIKLTYCNYESSYLDQAREMDKRKEGKPGEVRAGEVRASEARADEARASVRRSAVDTRLVIKQWITSSCLQCFGKSVHIVVEESL